LCHGCYAEEKNGSAASELRCRCAWLHHGSGPWTHRIQGCGAIDPRPKAGSPLIVIPIAPSVPSGSKLSRCGGKGGACRKVGVRRPTLTAPARRRERSAGRDEGTAFGSNKETDEGGAPACRNSLTSKAPYKACSGFTHVTAHRIAQPPTGDLCHEAPTHAVTRISRSSATGSIDNSPGGFLLH
jgi:hypothetical protein